MPRILRALIPFIVSFLTSINPSTAQIHISGSLSGVLLDTTYIVDSTITVLEGNSLTILPGAVLKFASGDFDIRGTLSAVGTPTDSITFKRNEGSSGWGGIDFYQESNPASILEYCYITGATASGVDLFSASPSVGHCTIRDNAAGSTGGGIYISGSDAHIYNCSIIYNTGSMGGNMMVSGGASSPLIEDCSISYGSGTYYGGGVACFGGTPHFLNCQITHNIVTTISTAAYGGAFYLASADPIIEGCEISFNIAGQDYPGLGGGIYCTSADPQIIDCVIRGNSVGVNSLGDGGGLNLMNSNPTITGCHIHNNYSDHMGAGIFMEYSEPIIDRCTFTWNEAYFEGGSIFINEGLLTLRNSIIEGSHGNGAVYFNTPGAHNITYCDFNNPWSGNFAGAIYGTLGVISGFNPNGDPCDDYRNIYLYPLFDDPFNYSFTLIGNSPCIDAGNPASAFDPDSTIADQGCFAFDQSAYPASEATLTPIHPPIIIFAGGGHFEFNVIVSNNSTTGYEFDVWTNVMLPSGFVYGPVISVEGLWLEAGASVNRDRVQAVPGNAPAGDYTYRVYVGQYPDSIYARDFFPFTKVGD